MFVRMKFVMIFLKGALKAGLMLFVAGFVAFFALGLLISASKTTPLGGGPAPMGLIGACVFGFIGVLAGGPAALLHAWGSTSNNETPEL